MTREELRDYVEEQRNLNNIPYHIYSTLIDGIDTLEQEPFKPMVEIDLYSVIKQKYIEREVLDKIRERVELEKLGYPPSAGYYKAIIKVLQIIDKYNGESENEE